jgi:acetyl esterase/lipase
MKRKLFIAFLLLVAVGIALLPSWRNYWLPRRSVRIVEDLAYGDAPAQKIDLYLPTTGSHWPVVVFLHGGFWRPLHRREFQALTGLHGNVGVALASSGIATAVVDYRQSPATVSEALDDVTRAVRWVAENLGKEGADPSRLYVVGHSAGGYLSMLLALSPHPEVRGFASLGGPYDLERLATLLGGDLGDKVRRSAGGGDGLQRLSPERNLRSDHPPILLIVGTDDRLLEEQRHMAAALRVVGGPANAVEIASASHMDLVMHLFRPDDQVRAELIRFVH